MKRPHHFASVKASTLEPNISAQAYLSKRGCSPSSRHSDSFIDITNLHPYRYGLHLQASLEPRAQNTHSSNRASPRPSPCCVIIPRKRGARLNSVGKHLAYHTAQTSSALAQVLHTFSPPRPSVPAGVSLSSSAHRRGSFRNQEKPNPHWHQS